MANIVKFSEKTVLMKFQKQEDFEDIFKELEEKARKEVEKEKPDEISEAKRFFDMRYEGQETAITVMEPGDHDWISSFSKMHK